MNLNFVPVQVKTENFQEDVSLDGNEFWGNYRNKIEIMSPHSGKVSKRVENRRQYAIRCRQKKKKNKNNNNVQTGESINQKIVLTAIEKMDAGKTINEIANELNIGIATLCTWKRCRKLFEKHCLQNESQLDTTTKILIALEHEFGTVAYNAFLKLDAGESIRNITFDLCVSGRKIRKWKRHREIMEIFNKENKLQINKIENTTKNQKNQMNNAQIKGEPSNSIPKTVNTNINSRGRVINQINNSINTNDVLFTSIKKTINTISEALNQTNTNPIEQKHNLNNATNEAIIQSIPKPVTITENNKALNLVIREDIDNIVVEVGRAKRKRENDADDSIELKKLKIESSKVDALKSIADSLVTLCDFMKNKPSFN